MPPTMRYTGPLTILRVRGDGSRPRPRVTRDAFLPFQSGRPFAAALVGTRLTIKGSPEVLASALLHD